MRETIKRHLLGRRCSSLVVYEAHGPTGPIDDAAMVVVGVDLPDDSKEWIRVFFDLGGWSLTMTNAPTDPPEDPTGELRFPARDVAAELGVAGSEIRMVEVVARGDGGGRVLLGFATGHLISVEHDGDRTTLQVIPAA